MNNHREKKRLTEPDPAWQQAYVDHKTNPPRQTFPMRLWSALEIFLDKHVHPTSLVSTPELLACIELLVNPERLGRMVTVIGCGPQPDIIRDLAGVGYNVIGVEPVPAAMKLAQNHVEGMSAQIISGTAEQIALEDASQAIVLMENVLEHVDSVATSLQQAYRILAPGGVLFVRTTNRQRFSITGINWEFSTRFYNWFPKLVKESYVFDQLHHRPGLANYSPRPAVHWFTFAELCQAGRHVGFAQFYSPYDLLYRIRDSDPDSMATRLRHWGHRNPWLRALAVSQMVGDIFMWKRQSAE
jgi:2-polyprenyl-3-methyl-5-hydroxy-6-metoxy-1,4-benzoquinol methylase